MKYVTITTTTLRSSKDLTHDQCDMLIILEDATLMIVRDEFLRKFRYLVEKLKSLYGIKEGGEE